MCRVLRAPAIQFLGNMAYGMYLYQGPVYNYLAIRSVRSPSTPNPNPNPNPKLTLDPPELVLEYLRAPQSQPCPVLSWL